MICFKCLKKGHSVKACNKPDFSVCTICKKLHHVNAHEAYTLIRDKKDGLEVRAIKDRNNSNNNFNNNKYKNNINANDTRIHDDVILDEEGYDEVGRLEKLFEGMRAELKENEETNHPYIYDDPEDTYETETLEGMISEVIEIPNIKDTSENKVVTHKKDKVNIQLNNANNKVNYNDIIDNLSDLFVDINNKKNIIKKKIRIRKIKRNSLDSDKIDNSQE